MTPHALYNFLALRRQQTTKRSSSRKRQKEKENKGWLSGAAVSCEALSTASCKGFAGLPQTSVQMIPPFIQRRELNQTAKMISKILVEKQ
ncbi:hypothetical protein E2C01_019619 [Portunus trituberculatus]|uniref:Uncharacterized protein n=1 Tax=Portunus trituberculatus TaxID=210409 RepID=A0A5B7DY42_PORTR|nr:hypothetical protein [Portunus trituberculatus]